MNLNTKDITFIIVTFKSDKVINDCLNTLPKDSFKIIIENSNNINLKNQIEKNYDNIEVILSENIGMGASNNIGLKKCTTKFAFILNPDVKLRDNTLNQLINSVKTINDFAILSPINSKPELPNYLIYNNYSNPSEDILSVDHIDGFSMLINIEKFPDKNFFDENFFLYLENNDICLRVKKNNENIYIIKNSLIDHLAASSSEIPFNEFEYLRNWHWMWSKFHYNKKHFGFSKAIFKISPNFLSALFKYFIFLILFKTAKRKVYQMRISGIINSVLGKKSWFRLNS